MAKLKQAFVRQANKNARKQSKPKASIQPGDDILGISGKGYKATLDMFRKLRELKKNQE